MALRRFNLEYLAQHRPCVVQNYALEWPAATKWLDKEYLIKKFGYTSAGISTLPLDQNGIASEYSFNPRFRQVSLQEALGQVADNSKSREGKMVKLEKNDVKREQKYIAYLDEVALSPLLRPDFKLPLLQQFLSFQGASFTLWHSFKRVPRFVNNERFICVLSGQEEFRLVSPVFRQNLYAGVYDDLHPTALPEDLELFSIDATKYPLMAEVEAHILAA